MRYTVCKADEYIRKNKDKVNPMYRLKYHMQPPIGWMNDPNGLVFFQDKYHVFYQYYPYKSHWGPMHWGHFVSEDLIKYQDVNVALAPDSCTKRYGCFSGGAIVDDNKLKIVYTKNYESAFKRSQTVCLATTEDTIKYQKMGEIFDNQNLPEGYSKKDFRDPAIYKINDKYYIFIGAKNEEENLGLIVVLESSTLDNFQYSFTIGPLYELGIMGECPSYHKIGDKDVLLISGCAVKEKGNCYKEVNASAFLVGKIDFENKNMHIDFVQEMDKGDAFYAPQFIQNLDEPVMIGWMEMWDKKYPTSVLKHRWAGALAIPRIISVENNRVYQKPISLEKYYQEHQGALIKNVSHIKLTAKGDFSVTFVGKEGQFTIEGNEKCVLLDTRFANNLYPTTRYTDHGYKEVEIEILLDVSSVELFINNGEFTITSRVYLNSDYELEKDGDVELVIHDLNL